MKNMVRKFILSILMVLALINNVFADGYSWMSKDIVDTDEYNNYVSEIVNREMGAEEVLGAYKIYKYVGDDIRFIDKDILLEKQLSSEYLWEAGTSSGKIIKLINENGTWRFADIAIPSSKEAPSKLINAEAVNKCIEKLERNSENIKKVKYFEYSIYHTSFALVITSDSEYLIPFGTRPDLTLLENGKCYTISEVSDILKKSFGQDTTATYSENNEILYGGVVNTVVDDSNTSKTVRIVVVCMIVVLSAGFLISKVIKNRKIS